MKIVLIFFLSVLTIKCVFSQKLNVADSVNGNNLEKAESIRQEGHKFFAKSNYTSALESYQRALDNFILLRDSVSIAKCYNNIGNTQILLGNNKEAIVAYYNAIEINKLIENNSTLANNYINLASYYVRQKEYLLAYNYYKLAEKLIVSSGDKAKLALIYSGLGAIVGDPKFQNKNYDSAFYFYREAIEQYLLNRDSVNIALIYNNVGALYYYQQKLDSATIYYDKSLEIKKSLEDYRGILITYLNLGNVYMDQGNYGIALNYYLLGEDLAIKYDDRINYLNLITNIIKCKIRLGNLEEADSLFAIYNSLNDSIYNEAKMKSLKELEVMYETEKKGRELEDQIKQTKEKTRLSYWSMGIAGGVGILSVVIILFFVQRQRFQQKIKDQEVDRLKKEQEIKELNAMMQGQEEERNRIAEDLHDRLGARLSAIKLLSEQSDNNKELTDMLEASIKETREISHNLSTDMLTRFGLSNTLRDLIGTVNSSNTIEGDFTTTNLEERLPVEIERPLYYMISELVNNTIKHSGATSFFIQLTRDDEDNMLSLLYEDDGKGFDMESSAMKGMGMKNLRARVEGLKGEFTIDTAPGKGLHVMAHIPIT
ncbi:MAG: tetratricopeptide repeat protein [Cyclobacteriaceae bacterium]|nr:tetratricopeptide repeat protein [Cyclobacteriaceae bacterium]